MDARGANDRMIGVFDSGVGGLSVWLEIVRQLPGENTLYLADQAHVPYGSRSLTEVREFSEAITRFLLDQGARVIVVACNTASAAALHYLRRAFPRVPFVGMEPAVKPAVERTHSGVVAVLATEATFQGELFASLLDRYAGDTEVLTQVCPGLVDVVESGALETSEAEALLRTYLSPLIEARVDQVVLGCTHYPFLRPIIERIVGESVSVIDPAPAVARQTGRVLAGKGDSACDRCQGRHLFYTTRDRPTFAARVKDLISIPGARVEVRTGRWDGDRLVAAKSSE